MAHSTAERSHRDRPFHKIKVGGTLFVPLTAAVVASTASQLTVSRGAQYLLVRSHLSGAATV